MSPFKSKYYFLFKIRCIKSTFVTLATNTILHTQILCIIYLFAYRNMYFYYTFYYFIYRICILSVQHIPGRYIKYAHSSCCSVHPLSRSIFERARYCIYMLKNTLCTIHPALGASQSICNISAVVVERDTIKLGKRQLSVN